MSAAEFREAIAALGYSQQRFAVVVGASPRSGQKWSLDEARVPGLGGVAFAFAVSKARIGFGHRRHGLDAHQDTGQTE
jgi:hypothetical protein